MLTGIAVFLILAVAGLAGEMWLVDKLRVTPANDWLADHVWLPFLRLPALIGFVLGAYPELYGLAEGPPLSALLDFNWFGQAINLLFVLPLLFSLLPMAGRLTALLLPIQGIALTALLFTPLAAAVATERVSYFPDAATWFALLLFGFGGHFVGSFAAERLPRRHAAVPAYDAVILLCQAPAIFAYGRALGAQL